jgi:hypothetical protein
MIRRREEGRAAGRVLRKPARQIKSVMAKLLRNSTRRLQSTRQTIMRVLRKTAL